MHRLQQRTATCVLRTAVLLSTSLGYWVASSPTAYASAAESAPVAAQERDGQHDFDFLFGRWKVHLKRKAAETNQWSESDGYGIYRKIWDGRANINEFFTENAGGHVEGLTLRTYNPQTRRWSLYWANSRDGILSSPQVGRFINGQGEFYEQDNSDGKGVLVRYVWSKITATSAHFEQAFSEDGGKNWDVNWISDMQRLGDADVATADPGQSDFDPLLGRWNFHLKKLLKPLTASTQWIDFTGIGECFPVWHGRAQLDTVILDAPTGHIEGLTLRLFSPKTHEWRLYWANAKDGLVVVPQIGRFKAGRGEFYAQDTFEENSILVKYDWTALNSAAPHFEQSFSNDGGKTWEVNWITEQRR